MSLLRAEMQFCEYERCCIDLGWRVLTFGVSLHLSNLTLEDYAAPDTTILLYRR